MYYNIEKKKLLIISILTSASMLAGCGSTVANMSPEEQALVTEYATNLLVKYSPVSDRDLLNDAQLEEGIAKEAEDMERLQKTEEIAEAYLQAAKSGRKVEDKDTGTKKEEATNVVESIPQKSVSQFFEEENNFSIEYTSYSLCDSYPESGKEEVYLAMDATEGKQLCVVKFDVKNLTSTEQKLDMFAKKGRFALLMGDGTQINAQSTLLANDLSTYIGKVPTGETREAVLVFEVPDDIQEIESMQLVMLNQTGDNILSLQ